MDKNDKIFKLGEFLKGDLSQELNIKESEIFNERENLKKYISLKISQLLDGNIEKLLAILYRIDVKESDFKEVITNTKSENIPEEIAELIIKRQEEKLYWREKYNN